MLVTCVTVCAAGLVPIADVCGASCDAVPVCGERGARGFSWGRGVRGSRTSVFLKGERRSDVGGALTLASAREKGAATGERLTVLLVLNLQT